MNKNYMIKESYRILIVDDEDSVRFLAAEALKSSGYQIVDLASPVDALAYLKENKAEFDLILLDMVMPQMNGDQLFLRIQEIQPFVPIVILSGLENVEEEYRGLLELGLKKILKKPIDANHLIQEVTNILQRSQSISIDNGLPTLMNNEKLYLKMLGIYYEDYHQLSNRLTGWLENKNYEDIQKWVHKVKGVSLNLGSEELYDRSLKLDRDLRQNHVEKEMIEQFALYHQYIIKDVERILEAQHVSNV